VFQKRAEKLQGWEKKKGRLGARGGGGNGTEWKRQLTLQAGLKRKVYMFGVFSEKMSEKKDSEWPPHWDRAPISIK